MPALTVLALSVAVLQSASAAGASGRFLEVHSPYGGTDMYDLGTVHMIQPGRFTMTYSRFSDAGEIALRLNILDVLKSYCKRPEGRYPVPQQLLTILSGANVEITGLDGANAAIEVTDLEKFSLVDWYYVQTAGPAIEFSSLPCNTQDEAEGNWYFRERAKITDGQKSTILFDCKRGLSGDSTTRNPDFAAFLDRFYEMKGERVTLPTINGDDGPSTVALYPIQHGAPLEEAYRRMCWEVTHEEPYVPK